MIYAHINEDGSVGETRGVWWEDANRNFVDAAALDSYMLEVEKRKPLKMFARVLDGWPVEIRDTDWEGSNIQFDSLWDYEQFCAANVDSKPIVVAPFPQKTDVEIWQEKLVGGWTDGVTGIKLKTSEAARNLFQGQVTMIREALDLGALSNTDQQSIWDFEENEHIMTVIQLRGLLLRYGVAWKQMFDDFAP